MPHAVHAPSTSPLLRNAKGLELRDEGGLPKPLLLVWKWTRTKHTKSNDLVGCTLNYIYKHNNDSSVVLKIAKKCTWQSNELQIMCLYYFWASAPGHLASRSPYSSRAACCWGPEQIESNKRKGQVLFDKASFQGAPSDGHGRRHLNILLHIPFARWLSSFKQSSRQWHPMVLPQVGLPQFFHLSSLPPIFRIYNILC